MNFETDQLRKFAAGPSKWPAMSVLPAAVRWAAACAIAVLLCGCASVIARLEGGRFAVLSAQALATRPANVIVYDKRRLPDGGWRWRARSRGTAIPGSGNHVCTWHPGQPAQCD